MKKYFIFSFFIILLTASCMYFPRSGQNVSNPDTDITFQGLVPRPGISVTIFAKNPDRFARLELMSTQIQEFTADSSPHAEAPGWYEWGGTANLSNVPHNYWQQRPGEKELWVWLYAWAQDGNDYLFLSTFDSGPAANQCITNHREEGPQGIINACAQKYSNGNFNPYVQIKIPCGDENQTCCTLDPPCNFPNNCNESTHTCLSRFRVSLNH